MDNQNTTIPASLSDEEALSRYIDQIIEENGLDKLGDEEKAKLREKIEEKLIRAVNLRLVYALPKEKFDELEQLVEQDSYDIEKISELVSNSGVDTEAIIKQALIDFRKTIAEGEA